MGILSEDIADPGHCPSAVLRLPAGCRGDSAAATNSVPQFYWYYASCLIVAGGALQGYANRTVDALFVAALLLFVGLLCVRILFSGRSPEQRVFVLTYATCIMAGGLAQYYSTVVFGDPQSTVDAYVAFLPYIAREPPFTTFGDLPATHNSRLAILVWQEVYKVAWRMGIEFGAYIGVMFNALAIGLSGSVTVRIARELFGDDLRRLRRAGTLFAYCGLFVLFGAVLLRDCFTTLLNTATLWGVVRLLQRPTPRQFILTALVAGASAYAMSYLRNQAVVVFGLFGFIALSFWIVSKRLDASRLIVLTCVLGGFLIASPYLVSLYEMAEQHWRSGRDSYARIAKQASRDDSIAMRLVINQPIPVRMTLGSGLIMITPLPLWSYFQVGRLDNNWLLGYHGIYQVLVMPLFLSGVLSAFRLYKIDRRRGTPVLFLSAYMIICVALVAATTFEMRHVGQFMPAFTIVAAIPNMSDRGVRQETRAIACWWFGVVLLAHAAWTVRNIV